MSSLSNSEKPTCVIVVGSTGLGKSSLIKALSGTDVHVSRGALSDTKDARVFPDLERNRILLDTMGAEDSDEKETDEAILRKVLHAIQREGIDEIKIAWVVKKETRKTSSLMTQARFIQSFRGNLGGTNPWDAVIILVKEGENLPPEEEDLDCQGTLAAAAQFGANYLPRESEDDVPLADVPTFGYTCVDWMVGRRRERKLKSMNGQPFEHRFEEGMLFEHEVVVRVNDLLDDRPSLDMQFKNQKCIVCGIEGDTRCVPVECHERSIRVHPKINKLMHLQETPRHVHPFALQKYHNKAVQNYHSSGTKKVHRGTIVYEHWEGMEYYHTGNTYGHRGTLEWTHSGTEEYYHDGSTYKEQVQDGVRHPGKSRLVCPSGHVCGMTGGHDVSYVDEDGNEAVSSITCGGCDRVTNTSGRYTSGSFEGDPIRFYHCDTCCNIGGHMSRWEQNGGPFESCSGTIVRASQDSCRREYRYPCCEGARGSTGCTPKYGTTTKYRCCDRPLYGGGCKTKMSCCSGSTSARGCSGTYSCCSFSNGSSGCSYSCCSRPDVSEGCKQRMACCGSDPSARGCRGAYSCCRGAQSSAGCETRYICCDRQSGVVGCQQKYQCCGRASGSEGCKAKFACCHGGSGSRGCVGEYSCCGQAVKPSTKGCVYACCNQAVGSPECEEQCQRCRGKWGNSSGCTIRTDVLPQFHDMVDV